MVFRIPDHSGVLHMTLVLHMNQKNTFTALEWVNGLKTIGLYHIMGNF